MWDLPQAPDVIRAFATLLGAVAAIWGVFVAHSGLSTWRKERDADLAKKLAAAVFEHRQTIDEITRPYLTHDEWMHFEDEAKGLDSEVYKYRWRRCNEVYEVVKPLLAEGDLRWGGTASEAYSKVSELNDDMIKRILKLGRLEHRVFKGTNNQREKALPSYEELTQELEVYDRKNSPVISEINAAFEKITVLLKSKI